MKIIGTIRSRFSVKQKDPVFKASGAYFDHSSLARHIESALVVLDKDREALTDALDASHGYARVRYHSKFHNKWVTFMGPGEVRTAIERNDRSIMAFKRALNLCQTDPHEDIELLLHIVSEAEDLAA